MRHYSRTEMEQVYNHFVGERLPGRGVQGINVVSRTQRYEIGSRLQLGNKVYHYAFVGVGATGLAAHMGAKVRNQQDIGFSGLPAGGAAPAGSWSLLLTIGAGDGPAQNGSFPANYLRHGTIVLRTVATNFNRGILSHPAKAAGAGTLRIQLDAPTPVNLIVGNQQEAIANRYAQVVHQSMCVASVSWQPVVGFPTVDAIAGDYLWLQTWGPCCCIGAVTVGGAPDQITAYVDSNAALAPFATHGGIQQIIGTVLASGVVAGGQGAPFVDLHLDP